MMQRKVPLSNLKSDYDHLISMMRLEESSISFPLL